MSGWIPGPAQESTQIERVAALGVSFVILKAYIRQSANVDRLLGSVQLRDGQRGILVLRHIEAITVLITLRGDIPRECIETFPHQNPAPSL